MEQSLVWAKHERVSLPQHCPQNFPATFMTDKMRLFLDTNSTQKEKETEAVSYCKTSFEFKPIVTNRSSQSLFCTWTFLPVYCEAVHNHNTTIKRQFWCKHKGNNPQKISEVVITGLFITPNCILLQLFVGYWELLSLAYIFLVWTEVIERILCTAFLPTASDLTMLPSEYAREIWLEKSTLKMQKRWTRHKPYLIWNMHIHIRMSNIIMLCDNTLTSWIAKFTHLSAFHTLVQLSNN